MAIKNYAYYTEGNKIAVIEKDDASANVSTSEYGKYKSPISSVTDGLEIKYTYIPEWNLAGNEDQQGSVRYHQPLCYFSGTDGANVSTGIESAGKLTFGLPNYDWSLAFGGNVCTFVAGDKILVTGSSRWNGVHEIASVAYGGLIVTKTLYNTNSLYAGAVAWDGTANTITAVAAAGGTPNVAANTAMLAGAFPSGTHYVWAGGTAGADHDNMDDELFKVTSDGAGVLTVIASYRLSGGAEGAALGTGTLDSQVTGMGDPVEDTTPTIQTDANDHVELYNAVYDPCRIWHKGSFALMEDESFDIDLPRYLANAVVYYLKAKVAEDNKEYKEKEYLLREFKKIMEKHSNAKNSGPRMVQGFWRMGSNV